jgi:dolichol-phosphate mannosyltransferase
MPVQGIKLGIVTPMANEIGNAEDFVSAVLAVCGRYPFERVEMYVVLDKVCTDGTLAVLQAMATREQRLKVVWAPDNRCVVDAYMRGYREAIARENDWILEIDAGFSHDPGQIPRLFSEMTKGRDCVFGVRFGLPGARFSGNLKRRLISWGGTRITNALLGTRLSDMTSGFELFSRKALEYILARGIQSRGPFFQTEIRVHAHGLDIAQAPIHYHSPSHQIGSHSLKEALRGVWRLYRERNNGLLQEGHS